MPWYEIAGWILLMVVILGILISLHELGHLIMAKKFGVYCFDYSIGFGPAFLHKRRKGGETYFSLRVIPLGGFVSMYGEPGAVPEGMEEPPAERSLAAIHKGKKAGILVAGIVVNFLLGFILIGISSFACPQYYWYYAGYQSGEGTNSVTIDIVKPKYAHAALDYIDSIKGEGELAQEYVLPLLQYGSNVPIIDDEVYLVDADGNHLEDSPRVAVYYPTSVIDENDLGAYIRLYPAAKNKDGTYVEISPAHQELGIHYYPDVADASKYLNYASETYANARFSIHPRFVHVTANMKRKEIYDQYKAAIHQPAGNEITYRIENRTYVEVGMRMPVIKAWNGWERGWKDWANKTGSSITAIGQGLVAIFTGGWNQMSSVVGMTAALPGINAYGGVSNIFFFAGLISINLAVFNLLPFPGLDGWQLLVTAIEGISKKKIPANVQGIVSIVGIGLLLALGVAIIIKDIVGLVH